ncbi:MAG: hypothetical protein R3A45_02960 [Bdellovibrionota bacterium]
MTGVNDADLVDETVIQLQCQLTMVYRHDFDPLAGSNGNRYRSLMMTVLVLRLPGGSTSL